MKLVDLIIRNFGSYGTNFILTTNHNVISFNDDVSNDLIVKSKFSHPSDKSVIFQKNKKTIKDEQVDDWLVNFNKLTRFPSVQEFNLSKSTVDTLQDSINHYDVTHLRFFTENGQIKIRLFDYRKFVYEISFINGAYVETILKNVISIEDFTFTINSSSFLKLPINDFNVDVLDNGIIDFISQDDDVEFFFRDQEIQEPIIQFTNEKSGREISLLLQTTSS